MAKPSGVIKANRVADLPGTGVRTFRLNDVLEEARAMVAKARREADEMLRQAQQQAARVEHAARTQAEERGYREGLERGLAQGRAAGRAEAFEAAQREFRQQHGHLVEACGRILSTIEAQRQEWYTTARQDLIDLAMAVARRVAHHVGREQREVVLANLEEAVQLVGARTDVTIAVNPSDAEAARAFARSLIDLREQWQKIRVVEEPEIAAGGCRVQWDSGSIDSTLETQLDRIEAELNRGMTNHNDECPNNDE